MNKPKFIAADPSQDKDALIIDWIRHTSLKVDGSMCYGQTDVKVSDTFEQEAAIVRDTISGRDYDAVYTSPLSRAADLAAFCGYPDAIRDPRVMEMDFGDWETRQWSDLIRDIDMDEWFNNWHKITPPNGENLQDLLDRVRDFIEEVRMLGYRRIAVFCHGGVINSASFMHGDIEVDRIFRDVPPYGSVNTIYYASTEGVER